MYNILTFHPIALDSLDHLHPHGTAQDNSNNPDFCSAIENLFGRKVSVLDLGCSGGAMVRHFLETGHDALGLEGSNYSLVHNRAEWPIIPNNLMTCDCSRPFLVLRKGIPATFDLITAWEVMEHIPEERLDIFLDNIKRHLAPGGVLVASIPFDQGEPSEQWHVTWKSRIWWDELFRRHGYVPCSKTLHLLQSHRVRGEIETCHALRRIS